MYANPAFSPECIHLIRRASRRDGASEGLDSVQPDFKTERVDEGMVGLISSS